LRKGGNAEKRSPKTNGWSRKGYSGVEKQRPGQEKPRANGKGGTPLLDMSEEKEKNGEAKTRKKNEAEGKDTTDRGKRRLVAGLPKIVQRGGGRGGQVVRKVKTLGKNRCSWSTKTEGNDWGAGEGKGGRGEDKKRRTRPCEIPCAKSKKNYRQDDLLTRLGWGKSEKGEVGRWTRSKKSGLAETEKVGSGSEKRVGWDEQRRS